VTWDAPLDGGGGVNKLYFGDNLDVLREHVKDESVDLIYLDPPFNSNATYNVLFKEGAGTPSEAQAEAFRDTWGWGPSAALAYEETLQSNANAAVLLRALRSWLGDTAMMAYLAMMAVRLVELRRTLKPTGSLCLHCDPTASHYLKLILDAIFGHAVFRNEIIWKRTGAHNSAQRFGPVHDVIFYYSAGDTPTWNQLRQSYDESYKAKFSKTDQKTGELFQDVALTGPGTSEGPSGQP